MRIIPIASQGRGSLNNGQILENKPIGFPQDGGFVRPVSSLFYWARAEALIDSTIGLHPHKGFEILSFVLEGRIRHFDTKTNQWLPLEAGDVQVIRAGNGISHSEHMEKDAVIFQIWLDPDLAVTLQQEASYDDYKADSFEVGAVGAGQEIRYAGPGGKMRLDTPGVSISRYEIQGSDIQLAAGPGEIMACYIVGGSGTINERSVEQDDFLVTDKDEELRVLPHRQGLDLFVIRLPEAPGYATYAERMRM